MWTIERCTSSGRPARDESSAGPRTVSLHCKLLVTYSALQIANRTDCKRPLASYSTQQRDCITMYQPQGSQCWSQATVTSERITAHCNAVQCIGNEKNTYLLENRLSRCDRLAIVSRLLLWLPFFYFFEKTLVEKERILLMYANSVNVYLFVGKWR